MSHPLALPTPQPSKWTIVCNKAQHFTIFVDSKVYTTHQYFKLKKKKFFWEKNRIGFVSHLKWQQQKKLEIFINPWSHGLLLFVFYEMSWPPKTLNPKLLFDFLYKMFEAKFQQHFQTLCTFCHKEKGGGKHFAVWSLNPVLGSYQKLNQTPCRVSGWFLGLINVISVFFSPF